MKSKLLVIILILLPFFALGQKKEGVLYGRITDGDGKALEYVNVAVIDSPYGVVSDSRGE